MQAPVGRICVNPASNPYTVGTVNSDSGRGLVVKNVVTDSSASTNYYYNSLDTATATVESSNTDNSLIQSFFFFFFFPRPLILRCYRSLNAILLGSKSTQGINRHNIQVDQYSFIPNRLKKQLQL